MRSTNLAMLNMRFMLLVDCLLVVAATSAQPLLDTLKSTTKCVAIVVDAVALLVGFLFGR